MFLTKKTKDILEPKGASTVSHLNHINASKVSKLYISVDSLLPGNYSDTMIPTIYFKHSAL